ncbi:MAG: thioesterase family protein [Acidimicrobiia bacterium]
MPEEPLFSVKGGYFVPTEHTRGPWDPRHQHGGAVAALVARAVERAAGDGFALTRLTLDLMRPVPLEPLALDVSVPRPGRRVLGLAVSVSAGDLEVEVVRAQAVVIRRGDLPTGVPVDDRLVPGPEAGDPTPFTTLGDDIPAFHRSGTEIRLVAGRPDRAGPATAWFRLRRRIVEDEEPTGVQRAAAAADFGNGISSVLPFEDWIYLNPDLTLHLVRPPIGEWIGLDARTVPSDAGMGLAESAVYDGAGRVGRAVQSLLLDRRA